MIDTSINRLEAEPSQRGKLLSGKVRSTVVVGGGISQMAR